MSLDNKKVYNAILNKSIYDCYTLIYVEVALKTYFVENEKDAILHFKNTIRNNYQNNRKSSFIKRDIKKFNTCIEIINDPENSKLIYTDTLEIKTKKEINPLEIEINIYRVTDDYDFFNDDLRNI